MPHINFDRNGDWDEPANIFFIMEEKQNILDFSKGTAAVLWMCFGIFFALI